MPMPRKWLRIISCFLFYTCLQTALADISLEAGDYHTCSITSAGGVQCWGNNQSGRLGDVTAINRTTAVPVSGLGSGMLSVASGEAHTCAVNATGGVLCWGAGGSGQLGNGSTSNSLTPLSVTGLSSGVAAVAAGGVHNCSLDTSGAVKCWGYNGSGQLGDVSNTTRLTPVAVNGLASGVAAIAGGYQHTCALMVSGAVKCWGRNVEGQLGDGTTTNRNVPVDVTGLASGVTAIAAGDSHTCALLSTGAMMCWGRNTEGAVGDSTTTNRTTPVLVSGLGSGVVKIAAGAYHSCAVMTGGSVQCWGANTSGQLGDGTTTNRTLAAVVPSLTSDVDAISLGRTHSCVLMNTGIVQCWGANSYGQLGDGTTAQHVLPAPVRSLQSITVTEAAPTSAAYNSSFTVAATATSTLPVLVSTNSLGCSVVGNTVTMISGIYSCTLLFNQPGNAYFVPASQITTVTSVIPDTDEDGNPDSVDTDDDDDGALDVVDNCPFISNVDQLDANSDGTGDVCEQHDTRIAVGGNHSCALTSAGGVQCWGNNSYGQLGDGTLTNSYAAVPVAGMESGVVAIAAGDVHTCALSMLGSVRCWGSDQSGQLGDASSSNKNTPVSVTGLTSGVVAISAGGEHTCALTNAGAVKCWGKNSSGQLGTNSTSYSYVPQLVWGMGTGIAAIAAGGSHTCALTVTGSMHCWGSNNYGQLGDGTLVQKLIPTPVAGMVSNTAFIAAGSNHTCAINDAGAVSCWGYNNYGQLGDATAVNKSVPTGVSGLVSGWAGIELGASHSCARSNTGAMHCWGYNTSGQLGNSSAANSSVPVAVTGLGSGVSAISAGGNNTCASLSLGSYQCWGVNSSGQLGDGSSIDKNTPVTVKSSQIITVTQPAPANAMQGTSFTVSATTSSGLPVALSVSGNCSISGNTVTVNAVPTRCTVYYNQSGNSNFIAAVQVSSLTEIVPDTDLDGDPDSTDVDDDNDYVADGIDNCPLQSNAGQADVDADGLGDACESPNANITAGGSHSCSVTTQGALRCWGANGSGQLGDGTFTNKQAAIPVPGMSSNVAAVSAGGAFTCSLTTAGGVWCWGANDYGQLGDGTLTQRTTPVAVSGLTSGVMAIATGDYHACALTKAGGVKCWGYNSNGQLGDGSLVQKTTPVAVTGLSSGVRAIAAGGDHTCALTLSGAVYCWGDNGNGALGDGTNTRRTIPVAVSGLVTAVDTITAGTSHSCALTSAGAVYCWGHNFYGQLGDGTSTNRYAPVAVTGLGNGVVALEAGSVHTCALISGGVLKCWGANYYGQLGNGNVVDQRTPVSVSGLTSGVVAFSTGANHSCAQIAPDNVNCWGNNSNGQIGDNTTIDRNIPVQVKMGQLITVTQAAPATSLQGSSFTVAATASSGLPVTITAQGSCVISGNLVTFNSMAGSCTVNYNQAGDANFVAAPTVSSVTTLVPDSDLDGTADSTDSDDDNDGVLDGSDNCPFKANTNQENTDQDGIGDACEQANTGLVSGNARSCEVTPEGALKCWGDNSYRLLGDGTYTDRSSKLTVAGFDSGVAAVAMGDNHTCVLMLTGGVQCWGDNGYGQLGDGTTIVRTSPVTVTSLGAGVAAIAGGFRHTCALTTAGAVKCWGYNGNGQLGNGTTTQPPSPVSVTGLSSGVVAITAGNSHTCALLSTGAVRCWGANWSGRLGDGTTISQSTPVAVVGLGASVAAISAGDSHTCALSVGGAVACWGYNQFGRLGDGTTTTQRLTPVGVQGLQSDVTAIATKYAHTCAVTTSGAVKCWGYNSYGQLGDGTTNYQTLPVTVAGLVAGVDSITTGELHTCARSSGGVIQCWGVNDAGQLGNGTTVNSNTPVVVKSYQSITVTQAAPASAGYNSSFTVAATATSSLPVVVSVGGACTVNANVITMTSGRKSCTVYFNQAGDANYAAALQSAQVTTVIPDSDEDGMPDAVDTDDDGDGVADASDNCPRDSNAGQADTDGDGVGNICEQPNSNLAAGAKHTCAITAARTIQCWGNNEYGQLGDGTTIGKAIPVTVAAPGNTFSAITSSNYHTCALTSTGAVKCWGKNNGGQIGDGTTSQRNAPVSVTGLDSGVVGIAAGSEHTCALTAAGAVKCWGASGYGQLGDGTLYTVSSTPLAVIGLADTVTAISAGDFHTCALTSAGAVWCWGNNTYGQLGDGTVWNDKASPVQVIGLTSGVVAITAGGHHTCAITITGDVKCWGGGSYGELGNGGRITQSVPTAVSDLGAPAISIEAGVNHVCAITAMDSMKCWGQNSFGQLGDGSSSTSSSVPAMVTNPGVGVMAISAGESHTCAMLTSGDVKCWGFNAWGEVGDGTYAPRKTPVAVLFDTDNDGIPDATDLDDDGDNVPDYIDSAPLNSSISSERILPFNSGYKGSVIRDAAGVL